MGTFDILQNGEFNLGFLSDEEISQAKANDEKELKENALATKAKVLKYIAGHKVGGLDLMTIVKKFDLDVRMIQDFGNGIGKFGVYSDATAQRELILKLHLGFKKQWDDSQLANHPANWEINKIIVKQFANHLMKTGEKQ